jgi:hypothetical protein
MNLSRRINLLGGAVEILDEGSKKGKKLNLFPGPLEIGPQGRSRKSLQKFFNHSTLCIAVMSELIAWSFVPTVT